MTPPSTFEQWCALVALSKKVLSPWKRHEHSLGCDCGYYPLNNPRRNPYGYWYREDCSGEEAMWAFSLEEKGVRDKEAIKEGFIVCNE